MTESEFVKRMVDEKLHYENDKIMVGCEFIPYYQEKNYGKMIGKKIDVFGCTQVVNHGKKWFIFGSSQAIEYGYADLRCNFVPEPKYIYDTDKRGKEVRVIVPDTVFIIHEFDNENEAFDRFYAMIKESMDMEI